MLKIFPGYKSFFLFLAITFLAILFFNIPSLRHGFRSASLTVLSAESNVFSYVSQYLKSKEKLLKENKELKGKLLMLSQKIADLQDEAEENKRLRTLLKFNESLGFKTISAEIVARELNDWTGGFVIGRGTKDGLKNNGAVCSSKGLLGKIVDAGEKESFVVSITHPSFKAGVVILDTRINGVLEGSGANIVKMLYIPVDSEVKPGEVVSTSKLSRIFPPGILIGEIISVETSEDGLYKTALIKPYSNQFKEEEVLCIINK